MVDLIYKVLIDTNIVIDYLEGREPFFEDSKTILQLSEDKKISGFVTSNAVTDIFYIMRKKFDYKEIIDLLKQLFLIIDVVNVSKSDILKTMELDFNDFEDALVSQCANREGAKYIVTRNKKHFKNSKTVAVEPKELIKEFD